MFPPHPLSSELAPALFIETLEELHARVRASLQRDAELLDSSRSAIAAARVLLNEMELDLARPERRWAPATV